MTDLGSGLIEAAVLVGMIWLIVELLNRAISRGAKKSGASPFLIRNVRRTLRLIGVSLAAAGLVEIAGLAPQFSFITFSGITGLAVSLALQNTLTNIIAGILILSDGIMRLHDRVEFNGVKGEVVKIGLRATWVRTESGTIAVISNSNLANGPLINLTATARLDRKL